MNSDYYTTHVNLNGPNGRNHMKVGLWSVFPDCGSWDPLQHEMFIKDIRQTRERRRDTIGIYG